MKKNKFMLMTNNHIFKFKKFLRPIIDILPYGASVLEVGVGNFQWLLLIRAYRPDLVITGLDFCEASREFSRTADRGLSR